jgi:signal transduction histidine kinase
MAEKGLIPVLTVAEEALTARADGRHLWRVFDNLLNNICKYAQGGTRVYASARTVEGYVEIVFKNISREPLNMDPAELTERFVRGDRSRNTEGSGLGLSIARSFTELQNGVFEVQIDGDLFKVIIKLPLTNRPTPTPEADVSSANEFGTAKENKLN